MLSARVWKPGALARVFLERMAFVTWSTYVGEKKLFRLMVPERLLHFAVSLTLLSSFIAEVVINDIVIDISLRRTASLPALVYLYTVSGLAV